jgi:hypothetical protein
MTCGSSMAISHDLCHRNFPVYAHLRPYTGKIRSFTVSLFRRIRSRTYTTVIRSHVLWRNMVVYGAYVACIRSYTTPYTTVYRVRNRRPGCIYDMFVLKLSSSLSFTIGRDEEENLVVDKVICFCY